MRDNTIVIDSHGKIYIIVYHSYMLQCGAFARATVEEVVHSRRNTRSVIFN